MKLIIALRVRVLHRNLRAEFEVGSDCLSELLIIGKIRSVERSHIERDEPLSLFFRYLKVPVDSDQMVEAKLAGEAVGATEGFGCEGRQMIDVLRLAGPEERLQQRILENTLVERLLEVVHRVLATCKLAERGHASIIWARVRQFDETILDHSVVSTSGHERERAIRSLEDLHPQVVPQERRGGESDRHSADSPWITVGNCLGYRADAEGHGAQSMEKRGLKATASGSLDAEVVVAVVPRDLCVPARHHLVNSHQILRAESGLLSTGE